MVLEVIQENLTHLFRSVFNYFFVPIKVAKNLDASRVVGDTRLEVFIFLFFELVIVRGRISTLTYQNQIMACTRFC